MTEMVFGTVAAKPGEPVLPKWWRTVDRWALGGILMLFMVGILLGLAASVPLAERNNLPQFYYVYKQLFFGSIIIATSVGLLWGWRGLLFFAVQALFSIIVLETVEYIQHYGLERKKLAHGKYERMGPEHSWNSGHIFSTYLLLNLQRHSDHHAHPGRVYHELESPQAAPQLPTGYPGLIALALIPPLWYWVMNPRLERFLDSKIDEKENEQGVEEFAI